jgi:hypothetical protein
MLMRNRLKKLSKWQFVILILLAVVLTIVGYNILVQYTSGYTVFTLEKDDHRIVSSIINEHPRFTFEYPHGFELENPSVPPDRGSTWIELLRPSKPWERKLFEAEIKINVQRVGYAGTTDGNTVIQGIESYLNGNSNERTSKYLKQELISISGIRAGYLSFLYSSHSERDDMPKDMLARNAYFDYKGFTWIISMFCQVDEMDETEPYFEHLLATFKILD